MTTSPHRVSEAATAAPRARALFRDMRTRGFRQTDYLFVVLLIFEWMAAIAVALFVSPLTWAGSESQIHVHVWAAFFLGGAIVGFPVALALAFPSATVTRHVIAIGQMLMGALLIHLNGGRIETHFHVFGSLAFLAFYRDWPVIVTASVVVALDHWWRGAYWPRSIFGVVAANPWRWIEHAGWVVFEDIFLIRSCVLAQGELWGVARHQAEIENTRDRIEKKVELRTIELCQANVELHREVAERRRAEEALTGAIETARAASRAKSEFLANMSHEIRTPMNGILGMTELALETPLNPRQREYLTLAKSSAHSLLDIINDILDFSKIEAGKLDVCPEPFRLRSCFEDTLRTLALRAHAKGLELACRIASGVPDEVVGDAGRLRQVLVNLVGNAIKFTERGEVVVSCDMESSKRDEVMVRVTVIDTGIGIPVSKLATIFAPFEQADSSTTRRFGGTGLGLTISAQLVRLMGGAIWLDSDLGRGSTFSFTIRLGLLPETARDLARNTVNILGLRVLIVDDNQTNRRILEEVLANWGMISTSVDGGIAALEAIKRAEVRGEPYSLALLDGMMPVMDGLQLAERIRTESPNSDLRMILLTSGGSMDQPERCHALGILDCLLKPVSQSELYDAIVRNLEPSEASVAREEIDDIVPGLPPARRLQILLAEDHVVNQMVAARMLENQGHETTVVGDGIQALAALKVTTFDAVLLDIQMPLMDGFETVAILREREQKTGGHLPVYAFTAHAMKGDKERCLQAGFDGYLCKPLQAKDLSQAMAEVMSEPGRHDERSHLSLERLLKTCDGDEEFLQELVESYLETSPRLLSGIEDALEAGDANRLTTEAHGWKGISRTLGFEAFASLCEQLEEAGRLRDLKKARAASASIHCQWNTIRSSLENHFKENT